MPCIILRMDIVWPEGWQVEDTLDLPRGVRGLTLYAERRTLIATNLHPWQDRATRVHESIHAADGPVPSWMETREERRVHRETARRLIRLDDLVHVLQMSTDAALAAAWLEVPVPLVWARLQGLHPSERAWLRRQLEQHEHAA